MTMAKARANKEGNIRLRSDGRFEVRVTVDFDPMTGKQKRISRYASTQEEAVRILNQFSRIELAEHNKTLHRSTGM